MIVLDLFDDDTEVGITYHLQEKVLAAIVFIDFPVTDIWFPVAWYVWLKFWGLSMMAPNTAKERQQNEVHYPPWELQQTSVNPADLLRGAPVAWLLRPRHISPCICIRLGLFR